MVKIMEIGAAAAAAGIGITLIGQASVFSFFLGKTEQRVSSEKELNQVKFNDVERGMDRILKASEKHTEVLEEVQECMHKMQAGKEC